MEGHRRVGVMERELFRRVLAANGLVYGVSVGAGVVAAFTVPELPDGRDPLGPLLIMQAGSVGFFALWIVVVKATVAPVLRPAVGWLLEGRAATPAETTALVQQPSRQTLSAFAAWVVGGPGVAVYVGQHVPWALAVASGVLFTAAGAVAMMVGRLHIETYLRPTLAEAFAGTNLSADDTISLLPRLLLSWMLGSAAYLAGVTMTLLASDSADIDLTYTAAVIALIGLVVGFVTTVRSASAVSERVAVLREAQRRVVEDLFGRHVGVEVARRAMVDGAGLRGEVRTASVLFVEIVGTTTLTQRLAPVTVIELLNEFFAEVIDCAASHGGWVNKFEGDAALCIFGAPEALDDHAGAALAAARDLRQRLDRLAAVEPSLAATIGVSTGSVVAGNVGSEARYEYTVIGDAVNEAARLTEAARTRPGLLLVSAGTLTAAGAGTGSWAAAGRIKLRGRTAPTKVFSLRPAPRSRTRAPAS